MNDDQFSAGGLFTTETEEVDLGSHHGRRLHGIVQRRVLRIGFGQRRGFRLQIARARPTAIRVTDAAGDVTHRLSPTPDPWIETAQRTLMLAAASLLIPTFARRR